MTTMAPIATARRAPRSRLHVCFLAILVVGLVYVVPSLELLRSRSEVDGAPVVALRVARNVATIDPDQPVHAEFNDEARLLVAASRPPESITPIPVRSPTVTPLPHPTSRLQKKCAPVSNGHRERRLIKDVCYTREEIQDILRNLVFNATTVLAQHNVSYFLESGTLLGSFREQGLIKHDADGDLGIDVAGYEYLRHNKVEVPPEYIFGVFNSTANPRQGGDIQLPIRLIHIPSALYVDVFVFLDWDGKDGEPLVGPLASVCFLGCVGCRSVPGGKELRMPRDWVYPLVDCPFEGRTMKCPNQSDKYLKYMYGPSYMRQVKWRE